MTRADLPQIERMFLANFRPGRPRHDDFSAYFERLFFESPFGATDSGLVSIGADGAVVGAVGFLPMRFSAHGRAFTARMACAFIGDERQPRAAARIAMALRARGQDMVFSDSASPASADFCTAAGGVVLPVQGLDWHCRFRPLAAGWRRIRGAPKILDGAMRGLDAMLSKLRSHRQRRLVLSVTEIEASDFADLVPAMLAHFAVRPDWSRDELLWLLAMASENRTLGRLRFFALIDAHGATLGCYAAYFDERRRVRVLDVLTLPRHEADVVDALCATLDATGMVEVIGAAHPHLLPSLSLQRGLYFRHRAFTCLSTRHDDIREAIARNDIYLGGLAGESWSRLMTDFF